MISTCYLAVDNFLFGRKYIVIYLWCVTFLVSAINVQIFSFLHHTEHNSLLLLYCVCMRPVRRFEPGSVARPWLWWSSSHNFHTEPNYMAKTHCCQNKRRPNHWTEKRGSSTDACLLQWHWFERFLAAKLICALSSLPPGPSLTAGGPNNNRTLW